MDIPLKKPTPPRTVAWAGQSWSLWPVLLATRRPAPNHPSEQVGRTLSLESVRAGRGPILWTGKSASDAGWRRGFSAQCGRQAVPFFTEVKNLRTPSKKRWQTLYCACRKKAAKTGSNSEPKRNKSTHVKSSKTESSKTSAFFLHGWRRHVCRGCTGHLMRAFLHDFGRHVCGVHRSS